MTTILRFKSHEVIAAWLIDFVFCYMRIIERDKLFMKRFASKCDLASKITVTYVKIILNAGSIFFKFNTKTGLLFFFK